LGYIKALVQDKAPEIKAVRNQHSVYASSLHHAILMTSTDNEAKRLVTEYKEYHESISKNESELNMIWKIGNELSMSDLWEADEDFDRYAKFHKPIKEQMDKYPLLETINSMRTEDQDIADYIDMVERKSANELTRVA